ncbi:hypothetical protein D3C86_2180210 [compost metagenome]
MCGGKASISSVMPTTLIAEVSTMKIMTSGISNQRIASFRISQNMGTTSTNASTNASIMAGHSRVRRH